MHFRLETDDPELIEEIAELKGALKCRSFAEDEEFLYSDLDRLIFNQKGWPPPVVVASALIVETYYERGALEPLARIYREHHWPVAPFVREFVDRASEAGRADLVESVWRGVLHESKRRFFGWLPDRERFGEAAGVAKGVEDRKRCALAAFDELEAFYRSAERHEAVDRTRKEREEFEREEFRKPLPAPSDEKIDETAFWRMLSEISSAGLSPEEERVRLIGRLEELNAAGIGKFHSIYSKTMKRLYHWNVWALAYVARGGCSDDSFHDFRSWLVSRGDPGLIERAISSPDKAAPQVPPDPDLPEGGLGAAIEAAYLARTGKLPKPVATEPEVPRGKEWPEDELNVRFPELASYYGKFESE